MRNFLEELKEFVLKYKDHEMANDLYFSYGEEKISYFHAELICSAVFGVQEQFDDLIATIEEREDFIRLLREDNARLRGGK